MLSYKAGSAYVPLGLGRAGDMGEGYRLLPGGASRKMLVVSFVQQYWRRWGVGPSYGKIADAMEIEKSTIRDAIKRAERDGFLQRPGVPHGGVQLGPKLARPAEARPSPVEAAELIAQLRAAGFVVVGAPNAPTICPLPLMPPFEHLPDPD
jgi:hypothetical protein